MLSHRLLQCVARYVANRNAAHETYAKTEQQKRKPDYTLRHCVWRKQTFFNCTKQCNSCETTNHHSYDTQSAHLCVVAFE